MVQDIDSARMTTNDTFFYRLSRTAVAAIAVLLTFVFVPAIGHVLLLLFAALLLGLLFEGLADGIRRRTPLSQAWSLGVVLAFVVLLLAGLFWLIGPSVVEQARTIAGQAPQYVETIESRLEAWGIASVVLERSGRQAAGLAQQMMGTLTSGIVNTFILVFGGVFLAATPKPYFDGVVKLLPARHHERTREVLRSVGHALRRWLLGRGISMVILGILTGIGLMIFGVPLALTLAVLAALLSFIPFVGGFIWLLVGVGAALATGTTSDVYAVIGIYAVAQFVESNLLMPLVQRKTTDILPFILIASQLILGTLAGGLGILVAAPLAVATLVLIQMVYVQDTLGNPVSRARRGKPKRRQIGRPAARGGASGDGEAK